MGQKKGLLSNFALDLLKKKIPFKMAELKTKKTEASVADFLATIEDAQKRADCETINALMQEMTGAEPKMWGASIVGFGAMQLTYSTGRTLDWFPIGFSPRKQALTIYLMEGYENATDILARLGKHTIGKSCLYVKKLSDIDPSVLRELIQHSLDGSARRYG
jgi:hypothetical protein